MASFFRRRLDSRSAGLRRCKRFLRGSSDERWRRSHRAARNAASCGACTEAGRTTSNTDDYPAHCHPQRPNAVRRTSTAGGGLAWITCATRTALRVQLFTLSINGSGVMASRTLLLINIFSASCKPERAPLCTFLNLFKSGRQGSNLTGCWKPLCAWRQRHSRVGGNPVTR